MATEKANAFTYGNNAFFFLNLFPVDSKILFKKLTRTLGIYVSWSG